MATPAAYRATRSEQETVIRWDRAAEAAHVWSADPVTWRKLARLGLTPVRETHFPSGAVSGRFYTIPVARFAWGLKRVGRPGARPPRRLAALPGGSHNAA